MIPFRGLMDQRTPPSIELFARPCMRSRRMRTKLKQSQGGPLGPRGRCVRGVRSGMALVPGARCPVSVARCPGRGAARAEVPMRARRVVRAPTPMRAGRALVPPLSVRCFRAPRPAPRAPRPAPRAPTPMRAGRAPCASGLRICCRILSAWQQNCSCPLARAYHGR